MTGNVWEWTASWFEPYPGSGHREESYGGKARAVRGGGWNTLGDSRFMRATYRSWSRPEDSWGNQGFRCAKSLSQ